MPRRRGAQKKAVEEAPPEPEKWPGVQPIFMTEKTLIHFDMKTGDNIDDCAAYKVFDVEIIRKHIKDMGFMSDFNDYREVVAQYDGPELMLIFDPESVYEQNFWFPNTAAKFQEELERLQSSGVVPGAAEGIEAGEPQMSAEELARIAEEEERQRLEEEKLLTYVEKPIVARPWKSLGSEKHIDEARVKNSRPPIRLRITRARREFGKHRDFNDLENDPRNYVEGRAQKSNAFNLKRMEQDVGLQAAPRTRDQAMQTTWFRRVNKIIQSESQDLSVEAKQTICERADFADFVSRVAERAELAMSHNETIDLFADEFACFEMDEAERGKKSEEIREVSSFIDLHYSKNMNLTAVDWEPATSGIVAVSCAQHKTFDERVDISGIAHGATILVWNFADLIKAQLILQSPSDIHCFRYNPQNPNIIVAGVETGQVVLWDLAQAREQLLRSEDNETDTEKEGRAPVAHKMMSYIEKSHSRPVADIVWLPKNIQIDKKGQMSKVSPLSNSTGATTAFQFATIAGDGRLLFWDVRRDPDTHEAQQDQPKTEKSQRWTPVCSLPLQRPAKRKQPLGATRFVLSADGKVHLVTESGEFCIARWGGDVQQAGGESDDRDGDDDDAKKSVVVSVTRGHHLSCSVVQRSPHFPDVFLTVADWTFCLWKAGLDEPIFRSPYASAYVTAGAWSPSRPAVVVIAKQDGTIDVWDLLDQSHKPALANGKVASVAISSLRFWQSAAHGHHRQQQFIAAGDAGGNLHILEIPRTFRRTLSKETLLMKAFYQRETRRNEYVRERGAKLEEGKKQAEQHREQQDFTEPDTPGLHSGAPSAQRKQARSAAQDQEADQANERQYRAMLAQFTKQLGLEDDVEAGESSDHDVQAEA